ncbi:hypothetical protein DFH07DRAFT_956284 [Mycena maculata]|uniref:Secreted protein n=1 Tax=Mycena maculata TaxID=230809 RepID=A0AAD7JFY1_9AGAR|nr:hypothetical protein DFH07DRAFT_956284 [Mycena maculata]
MHPNVEQLMRPASWRLAVLLAVDSVRGHFVAKGVEAVVPPAPAPAFVTPLSRTMIPSRCTTTRRRRTDEAEISGLAEGAGVASGPYGSHEPKNAGHPSITPSAGEGLLFGPGPPAVPAQSIGSTNRGGAPSRMMGFCLSVHTNLLVVHVVLFFPVI